MTDCVDNSQRLHFGDGNAIYHFMQMHLIISPELTSVLQVINNRKYNRQEATTRRPMKKQCWEVKKKLQYKLWELCVLALEVIQKTFLP